MPTTQIREQLLGHLINTLAEDAAKNDAFVDDSDPDELLLDGWFRTASLRKFLGDVWQAGFEAGRHANG